MKSEIIKRGILRKIVRVTNTLIVYKDSRVYGNHTLHEYGFLHTKTTVKSGQTMQTTVTD